MRLAWGNTDGYVFLSVRDPSKNKDDPNYWKDIAYSWPADREKLERAVDSLGNSKKDIYFSPAVYSKDKRRANAVQPTRLLWADLDEANPDTFPPELKPTASWETSPGRFQALWKTDKRLKPKMQTMLNKRLTYAVGADKGGWDLTQVLRIPGTPNHKYPDTTVKFRNLNGHIVKIDHLKTLPSVSVPLAALEPVTTELPSVRAIHANHKLPTKAKQILRAKTARGDRSERLWELECMLAEAGLKVEEIVALTKPTVWNKFAGRHDELTRLFTEASKAKAHVVPNAAPKSLTTQETNGHVQGGDELEVIEDRQGPQSWAEFDRDRRPIRWLVSDVWGESEVGFISGLPKSYKSWLSFDLGFSVATGTKFLQQFDTRSRPVLIIQEEDPKVIMQDRMSKIAGAKGFIWARPSTDEVELLYNLPENLFIMSNEGFTVTDETWLEDLETWIEKLDIGLVIMDPLMMMAEGVDEFKAFEMMSGVFKPLKQLRARTQAAICIVHHHTKSDTGGAKSMYGSVALWAWEEAALHLSISGPGRIVAERFSKNALLPPLTIEIGNVDDGWHPRLTTGVGGQDLIDLMSQFEGGASVSELAGHAGMGEAAIERQVKQLLEEGKLDRVKDTRPGQGRKAWMYRRVSP